MELDTEIFAVGKWNGTSFTLQDLMDMAETFDLLGSNQQVALKFGHNNEQPMTDGQPALGWVSKVWVAGDKLMAKFADLPEVVYSAIKKKLYKNVSIELDLDVNYKGATYPYVLTGVALLGADIPAVNTLKDLTHYLSRRTAFSSGRKMVFSAIAGQPKGDSNMDIAELTQKVAELTLANSSLITENAQLKTSVAQFTANAKEAADKAKKDAVQKKRADINAILEEGVKTEAITPAQRTQFSKLIRIDDDASVEAVDIAEVTALTEGGKKQFNKEQGRKSTHDDTGETVSQRVISGVNKIMADKEANGFLAAQALLFSRNPALAKEYANANDA